jgi:hypothetical protein
MFAHIVHASATAGMFQKGSIRGGMSCMIREAILCATLLVLDNTLGHSSVETTTAGSVHRSQMSTNDNVKAHVVW